MAQYENSGPNGHSLEGHAAADTTKPRQVLGIIESRNLIRDCLAHYFCARSGMEVAAVATLEAWLEIASDLEAFLVVVSLTGCPKQNENRAVIKKLSSAMPNLAVVVLSDGETIEQISSVFEVGARGYVPTSLGLDVALDAIRLVKAGGVYLPQSSLESVMQSDKAKTDSHDQGVLSDALTDRQLKVLDALRRGKANKIIAYQLGMCESTVKVHIRALMKKLNATNRTEVAYKANKILGLANDASDDQMNGKPHHHLL